MLAEKLEAFMPVEQVMCTMISKRLNAAILFIGCVETKVGILYIGEQLKVDFDWNIETEFLMDKIKREADPLEILNYIDSIRKYPLERA